MLKMGVIYTKKVDIVVPCYNEEDVLEMYYTETQKVVSNISGYAFNYIFVDDGSRDKTHLILQALSEQNDNVKYISFSRNFGKEAAMYAGFYYSTGDYVIVMDADLQHPPSLITEMINKIEEGHDCCAARRTDRKGESPVRSLFSKSFYKLSNRITSVKLVRGVVDYRIMSRQMIDAILSMTEHQRFSKGIFSWVGFDTVWIPYENVERPVGHSKWSFWGLFKYAIDGITAFSITPLRMVTGFGFLISLFAFFYIVITIIQTVIYGIDVPGYVTTLSAVLFLGGILEFSIGVIGEYIGHIYIESKNRPIFILKETNIHLTEYHDKHFKKISTSFEDYENESQKQNGGLN